MRVELLPSSQPPSDQQFLVTYLINDRVAIDAGSIGLLTDLRRQEQVEHVFVTHQHIDHIATLPILLENVYEPGPKSIEVLSSKSVLNLLQKDLFKGSHRQIRPLLILRMLQMHLFQDTIFMVMEMVDEEI